MKQVLIDKNLFILLLGLALILVSTTLWAQDDYDAEPSYDDEDTYISDEPQEIEEPSPANNIHTIPSNNPGYDPRIGISIDDGKTSPLKKIQKKQKDSTKTREVEVRAVQKALNGKGFKLAVDGKFGKKPKKR